MNYTEEVPTVISFNRKIMDHKNKLLSPLTPYFYSAPSANKPSVGLINQADVSLTDT